MMTMNKSWNRTILMALCGMFLLNTWLVKMLITVPSDYDQSIQMKRDIVLATARTLQVKCKGNISDQTHMELEQVNTPTDDKRIQQLHVNTSEAIILGHKRNTQGFLTIGIPTVKREKELYIKTTLESLIENTPSEVRKDVVIVIFAADINSDYSDHIKDLVQDNFKEYVDEGFIQVVSAPKSFYPPLDNLKRNFGDKIERVKWRSKQVVDFAFLFRYSTDLSQYYLQLEDDVITASNYVQSIRDFINCNAKEHWVCLEFSELGFIGKLFRSSMLPRLAQFAMLLYDEQPIDFLLMYFNQLHAQQKAFRRSPSLFQHIGTYSSLTGKKQNIKDKFFQKPQQAPSDNNNPPAKVYSNMTVFETKHPPEHAYSNQPGYFWAKTPIIAGDYLLVVFDHPARLKRVIVKTGSDDHPMDFLQNGVLDASKTKVSSSSKDKPLCNNYQRLGEFTGNGQIDVNDLETYLQYDVVCLRISSTKGQLQWLIVQRIAVWTAQ